MACSYTEIHMHDARTIIYMYVYVDVCKPPGLFVILVLILCTYKINVAQQSGFWKYNYGL